MTRRTPKADAASKPARRHSVTVFPPGQHPGYQPLQDHKGPLPPNVVPIRPVKRTASEIAEDLRQRRVGQERAILAHLEAATRKLEARHEVTASELAAIGRAMDHQTLLDLIEVGRTMLGQGART